MLVRASSITFLAFLAEAEVWAGAPRLEERAGAGASAAVVVGALAALWGAPGRMAAAVAEGPAAGAAAPVDGSTTGAT